MSSRDAVTRAVAYFAEGYSCSQSLFMAYAPDFGLVPEDAARIAAPFGGGIARGGETCGAVTGALMALGLKCGHASPEDVEAKDRAYAVAQEFIHRFKVQHGATRCRLLLGYDLSVPAELQDAREEGVFTSRCSDFVRDAAELLGELLK